MFVLSRHEMGPSEHLGIHRLACIERAAAQVARLPNVVSPILLGAIGTIRTHGSVGLDAYRRSVLWQIGVVGAQERVKVYQVPWSPQPSPTRLRLLPSAPRPLSLPLLSCAGTPQAAPAHRTLWQPFPMRAVQSEFIDCETRAAFSNAHLPSNSQCTQTTHSSHAVCVQLTHPAACAGQFR